jgi:ABC-type proline/glycine betaine transport systems, ATPase components
MAPSPLTDVSLECPTGQITVFVGTSGGGKTTALRTINRMVDPTAGRVLIDGQDVREKQPAELRRGIGYVIQQAGLFPHRTILDNVATVPYLLGWDKKKARARALDLMERVGLEPAMAKRYPFQLSGGQQQRVGVASALAADPPIMLMDEPFSAVDPVVRQNSRRSSCGCSPSWRRRSSSSPTTSTRPSSWATGSRSSGPAAG